MRDWLDSVLGQDYAELTEVIVVDRGSTDGTRELLVEEGGRVRVVAGSGMAHDAALGRAVDVATGGIVFLSDPRARHAPDYVSRCVATLSETGAGYVAGCTRPQGSTSFGRAAAAVELVETRLARWRARRPDHCGWSAFPLGCGWRRSDGGPVGGMVTEVRAHAWRFSPDTPRELGRHSLELGTEAGRRALGGRPCHDTLSLATSVLVAAAVALGARARGPGKIAVPLAHGVLCTATALLAGREKGVGPHRALVAAELSHWARGVGWWRGFLRAGWLATQPMAAPS